MNSNLQAPTYILFCTIANYDWDRTKEALENFIPENLDKENGIDEMYIFDNLQYHLGKSEFAGVQIDNTERDMCLNWVTEQRAKLKADNMKKQNPQPKPQFTKTLSEAQQMYLYKKLTEGDVFLSNSDTSYPSFCYVFGGSIKPEDFKPLKWLQNVQLLRELLAPLLTTYKTQKFVIPPYFKKKKGVLINHLPGNKPTLNSLSPKIVSIHKGLKQTL